MNKTAPEKIASLDDIAPGGKLMLLTVYYANERGASPTIDAVAEMMSVSRRSVQRYLYEAENLDYVTKRPSPLAPGEKAHRGARPIVLDINWETVDRESSI